MINKCNLPREELKGRKIYHYTSFDSFVKIWLSQTLRFGEVSKVNDLLEHKYSLDFPNQMFLPLDEAFRDIRNSYKQISFTLDYENMAGYECAMMWGQYADKANGVCIEFDYDILSSHFNNNMGDGFVEYHDRLPKMPTISNVNNIKGIRHLINNYKKEIFYTKLVVWEYENEYRIISNKENFLEIKNAISSVYLTSCTSNECIWVEKLLNGTSIPVLALCVTDNNSYRYFELVNPSEHRKKIERSKDLVEQAKSIYEISKNYEDADLRMKTFKLNEL